MPESRRNGSQIRAVAVFVVGTCLSVLTSVLTNNLILDPGQAWAKWILTVTVGVISVVGAVLAWRAAAPDPADETQSLIAVHERTFSVPQRWLVAMLAAALAAGFSLVAAQWPDLSEGGGIAVW